jgi:hypothetical protein
MLLIAAFIRQAGFPGAPREAVDQMDLKIKKKESYHEN